MSLSKAEIKREQILNGDLLKTILSITIPLVIYNLIIYFYGIFDIVIVAKYNIGRVESVAFIDQIKNMISTFGTSFVIGGAILVARKLGSKKDVEAKELANTIFFFELIICVVTVLIFIPFGKPFLQLLNVPTEIINDAYGYYIIQIFALAVTFINATFIGLEKAKGNTSILFLLNIIVVIIKVSLTFIFVFHIPNVTNMWIAISTLIAQSFMLIVGLFYLFRKDNIIKIDFHYNKINYSLVKIIFSLSIPIFIGKFLFSFGKVFVNSISAGFYGAVAVGALAISNTISGFVTNISLSFEDASSTIISQNVGMKNYERTNQTFKIVLAICVIVGIVFPIILLLLAGPIANFFAPEGSSDYEVRRMMIKNIFIIENIGVLFLTINAAAFGVLYGFGKTKATMVISIARLFIFRIPPILFMYYVLNIGYTTLGWSMMISNTITGLVSFGVVIIFLKKVRENRPVFDFNLATVVHRKKKNCKG